ncbi:hypothetical protein TNCV_4078391 [Trichonephila clavipes]|nr:hypothetical protein TNCV_4078391 [Trichonephila clavipes]
MVNKREKRSRGKLRVGVEECKRSSPFADVNGSGGIFSLKVTAVINNGRGHVMKGMRAREFPDHVKITDVATCLKKKLS